MIRRRARGFALVTVLATLLVVAAAGAVIASHTLRSIADARLDVDTTRARLAAEAAVETARAALARDTAWSGGPVALADANDGADAEVRVAPDPAGDPAVRIVHAVGRARRGASGAVSAQTTVRATLVLGGGLPSISGWE